MATVHLKRDPGITVYQTIFSAIGGTMKVKYQRAVILNIIAEIQRQQIRHTRLEVVDSKKAHITRGYYLKDILPCGNFAVDTSHNIFCFCLVTI